MKTVGIALLLAFSLSSAMASQEKIYAFKVYLDNSEIGYHNFRISSGGDHTRVTIEANFDVRFLFFSAYRYFHSNSELWQGDCLKRIDASTNDNGKQLYVRGNPAYDALHLSTHSGNSKLEGCVRTFAYWDPGLLATETLLNAQTGELEDIRFSRIGASQIELDGESVKAVQYRIDSEKFVIDLWYTPQREWLALESVTEDGTRLKYTAQREL